MDVTGLGATYLNDYQTGGALMPSSRAADAGGGASGGVPDFAQLLKKAAGERADEQAETTAGSSRTATIDKTDKLYEQCQELEIFMVKTLINSMRNTVQKSGLIDEGFAGKMYEDMLYDEYARSFTKNANFGMAEMAYLELTGQRGKTIIK